MVRFYHFAISLIDHLLSHLFQPTCAICEKLLSLQPICESCSRFQLILEPVCKKCGVTLTQPMDLCGQCLRVKRLLVASLRSQFWLDKNGLAVVHVLKYGRYGSVLSILKERCLREFNAFFPSDVTVIPVPLHVTRLMDRGFNQSEKLAEWISDRGNLGLEREALVKWRASPSQTTQTKAQRRRNLRGSFRWNHKIHPPQRALIVDDIYTTGATIRECAATLLRAGCQEVYAWTLFRTPESAISSKLPLAQHFFQRL